VEQDAPTWIVLFEVLAALPSRDVARVLGLSEDHAQRIKVLCTEYVAMREQIEEERLYHSRRAKTIGGPWTGQGKEGDETNELYANKG
jgi:hypothetical protein